MFTRFRKMHTSKMTKHFRYLKWRNPHLYKLYGYGISKGSFPPKEPEIRFRETFHFGGPETFNEKKRQAVDFSRCFLLNVHPRKINGWNLKITCLKRKIIFHTPPGGGPGMMAAANEGAAQGKGKSIGGESVRDAGGVVDGRGLDLPFNKSRMQSWKMKIIYVFIYICINYILYKYIYILSQWDSQWPTFKLLVITNI